MRRFHPCLRGRASCSKLHIAGERRQPPEKQLRERLKRVEQHHLQERVKMVQHQLLERQQRRQSIVIKNENEVGKRVTVEEYDLDLKRFKFISTEQS